MIAFLLQNAVFWPVLVPLTVAALTATLWDSPNVQRALSGIGVALMAAASLWLLFVVQRDGAQAIRFGDWDAPFGIAFAADRLGAMMSAATGLVAGCVFLFGLSDLRHREARAGFHPLFQGMLAGINGALLTGDIFNLYVWFEVMLITSMGLLVLGRTRAQLDGALKYAALNLFSTLLFLIAVGILYGSTGTLNMADLARILPQAEPSASLTISALLLFCGFGIKAGYFPLFFWLPASYHTASITIAAVFAALLTKVGVYACFRVYTLIFTVEGNGIQEMLLVIAAGTMLFGVFGALTHFDIRRILAFQIVSQIGFMLIGLALSTPLGLASGAFYILHDIAVKANLFLLAGAIYRASGTYDLRKTGGLAARHPLLAVLFLIPALSLAGIPPLSGFWGKLLVVDAAFEGGVAWLGGLALFVGLLNLVSMSRIWIEAFWKTPALPRHAARRVPAPMLAAIAILCTVTLSISLMPQPFIIYAQGVAAELLDPAATIGAVLPATPETGDLR